ncbi:MAG TPA: aldehyde dehydrogenase family protein [Acidisarcina sp.]
MGTTAPPHTDLKIPQLAKEPLLHGPPVSAVVPLADVRAAQAGWGRLGVRARLRVLRRARGAIARSASELAGTVPLELTGSLHRTLADTLVSEVLPLLEACRFLEREAEAILKPRREGNGSRPFWLRGVSVEVRREPMGLVLIIAPGNYPLFLPGAQALQALAAGNAVLWKPAPGGEAAAKALRALLIGAGLNPMLLQVLDSSVEAGTDAIRGGVDKVILTGSAATGRAVLRELAETATPAVLELSGCDAVFVLDDADLDRTSAAIAFGLRLNGSATCMAPRRLFVSRATAKALEAKLVPLLEAVGPVTVTADTSRLLSGLIEDAERAGARVICGGIAGVEVRPMLIVGTAADMALAQTDLGAPVLSVIVVTDEVDAVAAYSRCRYALSAAVFGSRLAALRVASHIRAGVVLVNDIIVSTADPRAPFGGVGASGFGVTRGREGLLEMTGIKTVLVQRSRDRRAYEHTNNGHADLFRAYIGLAHGSGLRARLSSMVRLGKAMMRMNDKQGRAAKRRNG